MTQNEELKALKDAKKLLSAKCGELVEEPHIVWRCVFHAECHIDKQINAITDAIYGPIFSDPENNQPHA